MITEIKILIMIFFHKDKNSDEVNTLFETNFSKRAWNKYSGKGYFLETINFFTTCFWSDVMILMI